MLLAAARKRSESEASIMLCKTIAVWGKSTDSQRGAPGKTLESYIPREGTACTGEPSYRAMCNRASINTCADLRLWPTV